MKPFTVLNSIIVERVGFLTVLRGRNKMAESKNRDFALPERVFEVYADTVYRLAFVRTKNISDSEDILQEVFMRYIKVWHKMESDEHIKAMLLRITVNCTNSLSTSGWFKKTVGLDENIAYTENFKEDNVLQEVLKLPVKYRTAIHFHYYCGYSVNEIAKILKTNPSTVKTHLSRGRIILKKTIKADDL